MASKAKPVTRTTRAKTPSAAPAPPSRTTRATNTRATPTPPLTDSTSKKSTVRKPFVDRNASPEGKSRTAPSKPQVNTKGPSTKAASNVYVPGDAEREPIRVCSAFKKER